MSIKDLIEICENYGVTMATILVLALACVFVFRSVLKNIAKDICHKRNRVHFMFGFLYLIVVLMLNQLLLISLKMTVVFVVIGLFYLFYRIRILNSCSPIAAWYIHKYKEYRADGLSAEHIDYFKKEHWYYIETIDKIEYARLKSSYYDDLGLLGKAYDAANEIPNDLMYESELVDFATMKAMLLWHMGDFSAALKLMEDEKHNTNPIKYMLTAFAFEATGDMDAAYEKVREAKDLCVTKGISPEYEMQIWSNLGRIQCIRGNLSEGIHYMQQANKMLEELEKPNADLQRNIKEPLIVHEAVARGNDSYVIQLLDNYKKQIPAESMANMISYNNLCVEVYRQFGDKKKVFELIVNGYFELSGKLDRTQRAMYQASTFRMLMNGMYVHDWLDDEIARNYEGYENLPVQERVTVYKEFASLFQQSDYYCVRDREPYSKLWEQIRTYYAGSAIADIDAQLISLNPHEIYARGKLMQDKLAILRYLQREQHIDKSKQLYLDLYNMYNDAGLQIEAVNALMTLADECKSPYNILIQFHPFFPPIIYQDWLDKLPASPTPRKTGEDYRLSYTSVAPANVLIYPQKIDVMKEQLKIIVPIVKSWREHPAKYALSIHLSAMLLNLDCREEAEEFYNMFSKNRFSLDHYASWLQEEYYYLTAEFK